MSVMWPLHPSSSPPFHPPPPHTHTHTSQHWRQDQVKEYFAMPVTFEKRVEEECFIPWYNGESVCIILPATWCHSSLLMHTDLQTMG